jgi:hypothetical protein
MRLQRVETLAAADARERLVHGDPGEPRRESSAPFELAQMFVRAHTRILRHVLGLPRVADDGTGSSVDTGIVSPHE